MLGTHQQGAESLSVDTDDQELFLEQGEGAGSQSISPGGMVPPTLCARWFLLMRALQGSLLLEVRRGDLDPDGEVWAERGAAVHGAQPVSWGVWGELHRLPYRRAMEAKDEGGC